MCSRDGIMMLMKAGEVNLERVNMNIRDAKCKSAEADGVGIALTEGIDRYDE